jgi:hypothetical protein
VQFWKSTWGRCCTCTTFVVRPYYICYIYDLLDISINIGGLKTHRLTVSDIALNYRQHFHFTDVGHCPTLLIITTNWCLFFSYHENKVPGTTRISSSSSIVEYVFNRKIYTTDYTDVYKSLFIRPVLTDERADRREFNEFFARGI